ncbi:WXG100 family type VII secretion target [Amycolatopsis nivea]
MPDGYTGADVYARMHRYGGNTASLDSGQQAAEALKSAHEELVTRIARLQGKMDASWEGDAAGKAKAGLTPLLETSQQASEDLGRSAQSLTAQNGGFHSTLNKLTPMDANRPDTNDLASYSPFGASDSEKSAARWDDADKNNKEAYGSYVATTNGNRNSSAKDYPVLNAAPAGIAVGSAPSIGGTSGPTGGTGSIGGTEGYNGGFHGGGHTPNPGTGHTPNPGGGHTPNSSGSPLGSSPVNNAAPPPATGSSHLPVSGNSPTEHVSAPDSTTAAGYTPKAPVSDAPGFGSGRLPTFGPNTSGTDSGFGLPTGGFPAPGGSGESGVGGRTGSGGSAGSRIGAGGGPQLGAGAGTGTGTPASGQSAARPGVVGGTGAKGSPGVGGMSAGKGKGTEDEEHQRKVAYLDDDVDELFGGYPDGMRPTPPTIGA